VCGCLWASTLPQYHGGGLQQEPGLSSHGSCVVETQGQQALRTGRHGAQSEEPLSLLGVRL
jgi:hypothetical protein